MAYYKTAQICENGHLITGDASNEPERTETYCRKCGAKTITDCPNCNAHIRGDYVYISTDWVHGEHEYTDYISTIPSYCPECGHPFPWTVKALSAAEQLINDSDLSNEDKSIFSKNVVNLVSETPETTVAAMRIKKILPKVSNITGEAIKEVLFSIASEAARRFLWPQ